MQFAIKDKQYDYVIRSHFVIAQVDYDFALMYLVPLISRLDFQRDKLRSGFYSRLEADIVSGCIMPPLTIAYRDNIADASSITNEYFLSHLENAFVLDGIQRLNTLERAAHNNSSLDLSRPIYLNILICDSMDRLLYRMITLNNGQRPMSARHQIEILASNLLDFKSLPIIVASEKQKGLRRISPEAMNKDVVIKGYIAFASQSYNIDNDKIIESRMDGLIAEKILNSDLISREEEFTAILDYVDLCLDDTVLAEWFLVPNNFIGFCAAMPLAYHQIRNVSPNILKQSLFVLESAFSAIDVSRVKLGLVRRKIVFKYFENYEKVSGLNETMMLDFIAQEI